MTLSCAPSASVRPLLPSNRFATTSTATETAFQPPLTAPATAVEISLQRPSPSQPCHSSPLEPLGPLVCLGFLSIASSSRLQVVVITKKKSRAEKISLMQWTMEDQQLKLSGEGLSGPSSPTSAWRRMLSFQSFRGFSGFSNLSGSFGNFGSFTRRMFSSAHACLS